MDLKATLNLPKTDFPMKGNLPTEEPRRLERWREADLYGQLRAARKDAPLFVLHDGPPYANGHIHIGHVVNKVLKDLLVRSRSMTGHNAPYVPGWDCHGLPIELKVDKDLGSKKREMTPVSFRRACRAYAEKYVAVQRLEFERLGIMGEWDKPYLTMSPEYQATIVRELAGFIEKDLVYKAKKAVHWCISCRTALAEAEVEYDENHVSPSIDVKFPLADDALAKLVAKHPALKGKHVSAVIWTTTPWTLPANLALAFHPEAEYAFYPVNGTEDVVLLAKALQKQAETRWWGKTGKLGAPLAEAKGAELEHVRFRHPWIDRDSPGVLADYVTLDTGTGIVHTAPGHGWDDYVTGVKYGLDIYCPVDESGHMMPEVEHFAGKKVWDANPLVIDLLKQRGVLLQSGKDKHSYPTCWRCKNPIIFRATFQWFIKMDSGLREAALAEIDRLNAAGGWYPAWGYDRIRNMIAGRPDWCISRQRLWGVPIPAFYCDGCGKAHLSADLVRRVADLFERENADAWYDREAGDLLPPGYKCACGGDKFTKERDILDVWFDSGSSHAAVLGKRKDMPWPADVYLEGSDQHRGWFHSSLLIGVAVHGTAPYRQVITHGFTIDEQGQKQSKSLGNVVDPQKTINEFGAEILRLWVTMVDYREDMRISHDIVKQVAEAYRKIRNTLRYLLSNLSDFDPQSHARPESALDEIDRYALHRHRQVTRRILDAYQTYEFHVVYHQLVQYCASDLSSFYLDVLKDRLYCDAADSPRRRSAQTVLHQIAVDLTQVMAPVLPFTADEVWALLPRTNVANVHLSLFPAPEAPDEAVLTRWSALLGARDVALKALEQARAAKTIGTSLEAQVLLRAPEALLATLRAYEQQGPAFPTNLANLFIVSSVRLESAESLSVEVSPAAGRKCERCWTYSTGVGEQSVHSGVCPRCAAVLGGGGQAAQGACA
jgi:isoleucyl-tRNA synthetase